MEQLGKLFLKAKREPTCLVTDRETALMNAQTHIFPKAKFLLCRRHVKQNIQDFAGKQTHKERASRLSNAYYELFKQTTEMDYRMYLSSILMDWNDLPKVHAYVQNSWLNPYKDRLFSAWTDNVFSLGQNTTNRYVNLKLTLLIFFRNFFLVKFQLTLSNVNDTSRFSPIGTSRFKPIGTSRFSLLETSRF